VQVLYAVVLYRGCDLSCDLSLEISDERPSASDEGMTA